MHGLFFFFIQKFAEATAATASLASSRDLRSRLAHSASHLPEQNCPDTDALGLLAAVSDSLGEPLELTYGRFGEYVAPHLVRMAGPRIEPSWRTLDIVQHADDLIQAMVQEPPPRRRSAGARVRASQCVRASPRVFLQA